MASVFLPPPFSDASCSAQHLIDVSQDPLDPLLLLALVWGSLDLLPDVGPLHVLQRRLWSGRSRAKAQYVK